MLCRPTSSAPHTSGDPSQPIIISDTPSPAVSIITIPSDTEDEDDAKVPPARWLAFIALPRNRCALCSVFIAYSAGESAHSEVITFRVETGSSILSQRKFQVLLTNPSEIPSVGVIKVPWIGFLGALFIWQDHLDWLKNNFRNKTIMRASTLGLWKEQSSRAMPPAWLCAS